MASNLNKKNTLTYFEEVLNKQNFGLISQLLSAAYRYNGEPQTAAQNQQWIGSLHATYPGLRFTIEAILAEDDKVGLRWRLDAPALGSRPAGFTKGTNILTFDEGGMALTNEQNSGRITPLNSF